MNFPLYPVAAATGLAHHWDKLIVAAIAVVALGFLVRHFRKGECNCGNCSKSCPARKSENKK